MLAETALLWLIVAIPAIFLIFVHADYRSILWGRCVDIKRILGRGDTFKAYLKAFDSASDAEDRPNCQTKAAVDKTIEDFFYRKYGKGKYYFPLAANALVSAAFVAMAILRSGFHMGLPIQLEQAIRGLPAETVVGLAGGFVWGIYDILVKYQAMELSPVDLHMIWLRMLIASILAPIVSKPFADSLKLAVAFAIGAFPVRQLFDFVSNQAKDRLKLGQTELPKEKSTLRKLHDLSEDMVDRLENEGFESASQLATADPIKLLLRTNIEWKTILDIIDQAILFDYFGEDKELLRPMGIRGATDLASIQDDLISEDSKVRELAEKLVGLIAGKLTQNETVIRYAIVYTYNDVQADFVWHLWGDPSPQPVVAAASAAP
jgi:hypothetical protein